MCIGIALPRTAVPDDVFERHGLHRRLHERGGVAEVRFYYRDPRPRLPVLRDGQFQVVRWGNARGRSRLLPRTGWTWLESVVNGSWKNVEAFFVEVPATFGLEGGFWFPIRHGIRALLVADERRMAVAYLVCEESSQYFRVMTQSRRMPVLIREWW
jgi:hypothetical protein